MNKLLSDYRVAVEFPKISGFEQLETLDLRDALENLKSGFTTREQNLLAEADQRLLAQAAVFYAELVKVADLSEERFRHQPTPTHWWWYLDVLVTVPMTQPNRSFQLEPAIVAMA